MDIIISYWYISGNLKRLDDIIFQRSPTSPTASSNLVRGITGFSWIGAGATHTSRVTTYYVEQLQYYCISQLQYLAEKKFRTSGSELVFNGLVSLHILSVPKTSVISRQIVLEFYPEALQKRIKIIRKALQKHPKY